MSITTHDFFIDPFNFDAILYQVKKAGICKANKEYKTGDLLRLRKVNSDQEVTRRISHITQGGQNGIQDGYMLVSLSIPAWKK